MQMITIESRSTHVFVHQPPEVVWNFFTTPSNWEKWSGMTLDTVEPRWQTGALLVWRYGYPARILQMQPNEEIQIEMSWTKMIWRFVPIGKSFTRIEVTEVYNQGLDAPEFETWEADIRGKLVALQTALESLPPPIEEEPAAEEAIRIPATPAAPPPKKASFNRYTRWLLPALALLAVVFLIGEAGSTYWLSKQGLIGSPRQIGQTIPTGIFRGFIPVTGKTVTPFPTIIPSYVVNFNGKSGYWAGSQAWVENDHLVLASDTKLVWIALGGKLKISPYYLQADLYPENSSGTFGIAFGLAANSAHYEYLVDPETQQYTLRRWNGSEWEDLLPWTITDQIKKTDSFFTLGIYTQQDVITLYLNGAELAAYTDSTPLPSGSIGIASHISSGEIWADNIYLFPRMPTDQ
jgi:hypothetical protein